jgi:hypothetical protein
MQLSVQLEVQQCGFVSQMVATQGSQPAAMGAPSSHTSWSQSAPPVPPPPLGVEVVLLPTLEPPPPLVVVAVVVPAAPPPPDAPVSKVSPHPGLARLARRREAAMPEPTIPLALLTFPMLTRQ